jgi:hypothetical protein
MDSLNSQNIERVLVNMLASKGINMFDTVSAGAHDESLSQTIKNSDGSDIHLGPNILIRCYNLYNYTPKDFPGSKPQEVLKDKATMVDFIREISEKIIPSTKRAVWFHEVNCDLGGARGSLGHCEGRPTSGEINLEWLNLLENKLKQILQAARTMKKTGMLKALDDDGEEVSLCLFYSCICSNLSYNDGRELFGQKRVIVNPSAKIFTQEHLDLPYGLVPAYRAKINFYMVRPDGTFREVEEKDKEDGGRFHDYFNQPLDENSDYTLGEWFQGWIIAFEKGVGSPLNGEPPLLPCPPPPPGPPDAENSNLLYCVIS